MPDMLVRLYDLPSSSPLLEKLEEQGITIQRAMALIRFGYSLG